jgi:hypothetical protein
MKARVESPSTHFVRSGHSPRGAGLSYPLACHERGVRQHPESNGSASRTRTCDPVVNSHLLYQLSYRGIWRTKTG